ncbi:MAG: cyclodeaminase/cyclohydrolase family protein [Synergistaceae bacterium]|nr:cyclodeaminase/cyclohydrolase family protein [Synergistaceae bacterium]
MLTDLTLRDFVKELGSSSPAPGGGSAAALAGALSSSLCSMVASLTAGKERFKDVWPEMQEAGETSRQLTEKLIELVNQDAEAYNRVMEAVKMPKTTEDEKSLREKAMQDALKSACRVPLETVETVAKVARVMESLLFKCNPNAITDVGSAGRLAWAAAHAAAYNVEVNLKAISDLTFVEETRKKLQFELSQVEASAIVAEAEMQKRLS